MRMRNLDFMPFKHRISCVSISFMAWIALVLAVALPTSTSEARSLRVELRCEIVPASIDQANAPWKLELKKSTGELIREALVGGAGIARFKNLKPAIYMVCLSGEGGRYRCRSFDLYPPPNGKPVFQKKLMAPLHPLNRRDAYRVSVSQLAVPAEARREMVRSEKAQLRGNTQESLQHLEHALRIYPQYAKALNNIGTHYQKAGDFTQAIDYFTRVTQLEPDLFAGWVNLGSGLLATGQFQSALQVTKRALALRPDNIQANSQMGRSCYHLRRFSEAQEYFEKVSVLDPSSAEFPQLFLAQIALAEGRPQGAQHYFSSCLQLHPYSPLSRYLRQSLASLSANKSRNTREISQYNANLN